MNPIMVLGAKTLPVRHDIDKVFPLRTWIDMVTINMIVSKTAAWVLASVIAQALDMKLPLSQQNSIFQSILFSPLCTLFRCLRLRFILASFISRESFSQCFFICRLFETAVLQSLCPLLGFLGTPMAPRASLSCLHFSSDGSAVARLRWFLTTPRALIFSSTEMLQLSSRSIIDTSNCSLGVIMAIRRLAIPVLVLSPLEGTESVPLDLGPLPPELTQV